MNKRIKRFAKWFLSDSADRLAHKIQKTYRITVFVLAILFFLFIASVIFGDLELPSENFEENQHPTTLIEKKEKPSQPDNPPQGQMMFKLHFAGLTDATKYALVTVRIQGDLITVYNLESNPRAGGRIVVKGTLMKHDSGLWIIGKSISDCSIKEIGGCTGGPTTIDFVTKSLNWC